MIVGQQDHEEEMVKAACALARGLMKSDETERALYVLDQCLPGFYREHKPKEVVELKQLILRNLMHTRDYMENDLDLPASVENSTFAVTQMHRGLEIAKVVRTYNEKGITPHIVDLGPGNYWLPIGLKAISLKFTYHPLHIHPVSEEQVKKMHPELWETSLVTDRPVIFVACEIIEHLWNPYEIAQHHARHAPHAQYIFMSTPLYTYERGNPKTIESHMVGKVAHIKTYTPNEFCTEAREMFYGYNWDFMLTEIMLLRGEKIP